MKKSILALLAICMIFHVGCTDTNNKNIEVKENKENIAKVTGEDKEILNRSEELSDIVVEIFGIDDATTIIFNDTALIGITLSHDGELTKDMKETIISIVKEKDSQIKEINLTENPKIFKQIDNIVSGLLQGNSYDDYILEINKIIEKINK
ncbi:YhcN/YlaJ family sporulation lipoprotein [Wansuia hejianensis]|uniref:YhcN/YlaJ family sporulation lipoprotein n=1 Tax=Wansuia hejianensis TaxID=2763667 RepID=A0A926EYI4_9FIRM|nr:YhcN/YlaJ family sporulation lipoprotein [Wansuia hejianensis]MBC8590723.1 YhcN/YlaJ family sporulation lipoprotein [Wansuia hejianensis]